MQQPKRPKVAAKGRGVLRSGKASISAQKSRRSSTKRSRRPDAEFTADLLGLREQHHQNAAQMSLWQGQLLVEQSKSNQRFDEALGELTNRFASVGFQKAVIKGAAVENLRVQRRRAQEVDGSPTGVAQLLEPLAAPLLARPARLTATPLPLLFAPRRPATSPPSGSTTGSSKRYRDRSVRQASAASVVLAQQQADECAALLPPKEDKKLEVSKAMRADIGTMGAAATKKFTPARSQWCRDKEAELVAKGFTGCSARNVALWIQRATTATRIPGPQRGPPISVGISVKRLADEIDALGKLQDNGHAANQHTLEAGLLRGAALTRQDAGKLALVGAFSISTLRRVLLSTAISCVETGKGQRKCSSTARDRGGNSGWNMVLNFSLYTGVKTGACFDLDAETAAKYPMSKALYASYDKCAFQISSGINYPTSVCIVPFDQRHQKIKGDTVQGTHLTQTIYLDGFFTEAGASQPWVVEVGFPAAAMPVDENVVIVDVPCGVGVVERYVRFVAFRKLPTLNSITLTRTLTLSPAQIALIT